MNAPTAVTSPAIAPLAEAGDYRTGSLPSDLTVSQITAVLGFGPNIADDAERVTASWGFTVNGVRCGIWDYDGFRWSIYDPERVLPALFSTLTGAATSKELPAEDRPESTLEEALSTFDPDTLGTLIHPEHADERAREYFNENGGGSESEIEKLSAALFKASEDYQRNAECRCDDCGWRGSTSDIDPVRNIWERCRPGGEMPAGECPSCDSFAYMLDGKAARAEQREQVLRDALSGLCSAINEISGQWTESIDNRMQQADAALSAGRVGR